MPRSRIRFGEGQVLQLRVELDGFTPAIWRRLVVSARASLHELHAIIQHSFGRDVALSYGFTVDGVRFVGPEDDDQPRRGAERVALQSLELHAGARFVHAAEELSSSWHQVIAVEQSAPRMVGQRLPWCVAGSGAAPPAECDGPDEFRELLSVIADPLDPRAADWYRAVSDDFDPRWADIPGINAALAKVPKHRPAA